MITLKKGEEGMITLKKWEIKEAKAAAEALHDLVTESFCDIVGECDHRIVSRLIAPETEDDELFTFVFEAYVMERLIKRLGGK
jgi:hypothetical protein